MTDYTSAEFWKGAPETSTHYQPPRGEGFNPVFWRMDDGVLVEAWAVRQGGDFHHVPNPSYIDDVYGRLIPRPAPQWNGSGLPPVGTVCEARIPHHTTGGLKMLWCEVEVLAHAIVQGAEYSWVKEAGADGGFYAPMMLSFRPIRTQAQIAADEREAFAEKLVSEMGKSPTGYPNAMNQARKIFDLGYRKGDAK